MQVGLYFLIFRVSERGGGVNRLWKRNSSARVFHLSYEALVQYEQLVSLFHLMANVPFDGQLLAWYWHTNLR